MVPEVRQELLKLPVAMLKKVVYGVNGGRGAAATAESLLEFCLVRSPAGSLDLRDVPALVLMIAYGAPGLLREVSCRRFFARGACGPRGLLGSCRLRAVVYKVRIGLVRRHRSRCCVQGTHRLATSASVAPLRTWYASACGAGISSAVVYTVRIGLRRQRSR